MCPFKGGNSSSDGAVFGGEGTSGNSGVGLFGAVTVQPSSEI
jgi:hypothetical protein